jgi:DNA-directed RNA polymerase subunit RPC12/RpoP
MAEIANIASFTKDGYRNLSCPLCGYFLKVKMFLNSTSEERKYKCKRCKSKLALEYMETDEVNVDGGIKIGLSITSAVNSTISMRLMRN